jgi:membrane protease YdiL (CAAX protease family)
MQLSSSTLLLITFLLEGLLCLSALVLSKLLDIQLFSSGVDPFHDIVLGAVAACFPLLFFIFSLSRKAGDVPVLRSLRRTIITDIKGIFSHAGLVDILFISLMAGFAEEMFFRGILQAQFGIIIASVFFGLVHFITSAYVAVTILMGFYIGALYHFFGSLLIPVVVHIVYDFGALVYLRYFVEEDY